MRVKSEKETAGRLRELGEWMALGFYEALDEPWPRAYGRAYRRLYENMDIVIPPGRLLVPCEPLPHSRTRASHDTWTASALICEFDHNRGLRVNRQIADDKKRQFPEHATFIDEFCADLERRLPHFGGYTHSNPDIRRVVTEGVLAMEVELDEQLAAVKGELRDAQPGSDAGRELQGQLNLLLALEDYVAGVHAFYERTLAAVRQTAATATDPDDRRKLGVIADAFGKTFMRPAETFVQGLLAVHLCWMLDGHDSLGRIDQALGPVFERDQDAGRLDPGTARRGVGQLRAVQRLERPARWLHASGPRRLQPAHARVRGGLPPESFPPAERGLPHHPGHPGRGGGARHRRARRRQRPAGVV